MVGQALLAGIQPILSIADASSSSLVLLGEKCSGVVEFKKLFRDFSRFAAVIHMCAFYVFFLIVAIICPFSIK